MAILIAVLSLYAASLKLKVHRSAEAAPAAPAATPADGKPTSNEIPETQQLG
ncbi:MAG TPA: hypothetical protein VMK66_03140 [Myxococcales bacterium]|nr:hypothetical protein [Myxococcales bacterium]